MNRLALKKNKGQATTELAIMGTVVLMMLAYLLQQGYFYNSRQALEMYAFREALQLSRAQERGISLTVSRDIVVPSFFSALSRQRLMASSSVEVNPYKLYAPDEDSPQDISSYQLLQMDEAMIRDGKFIMVPPTKVKMESDEGGQWQWMNSSIREIDAQIPPIQPTPPSAPTNIYTYAYQTSVLEDGQAKTITKNLETQDNIDRKITFEDKEKMMDDYNKDTTDTKIEDIDDTTIPSEITFSLNESIGRGKTTTTPHNLGGGDNE